jgi:hypothetical protein
MTTQIAQIHINYPHSGEDFDIDKADVHVWVRPVEEDEVDILERVSLDRVHRAADLMGALVTMRSSLLAARQRAEETLRTLQRGAEARAATADKVKSLLEDMGETLPADLAERPIKGVTPRPLHITEDGVWITGDLTLSSALSNPGRPWGWAIRSVSSGSQTWTAPLGHVETVLPTLLGEQAEGLPERIRAALIATAHDEYRRVTTEPES